jgi:hypothetical protein
MDQSAETLPLEDSLGLPDWIIDNSMEDAELPNPVSERSVPDDRQNNNGDSRAAMRSGSEFLKNSG